MITALRSEKWMRRLLIATMILVIPSFVVLYGWGSLSDRNLARANRLGAVTISLSGAEEVDTISRPELEKGRTQTAYALFSRLFQIASTHQGLDFQMWQDILRAQNPKLSNSYVMERIADAAGMAAFAQSLGLVVPGADFQQRMRNMNVTRDALRNALRQEGRTEAEFYASQKHDMASDNGRQVFSLIPKASLYELWQEYLLGNEKIEAEWVTLPIGPYASEIQPTDDEVIDYFTRNRDTFALPNRVKFNYVAVDLGALRQSLESEATESEIQALYEEKKATDFLVPKEVEGRQIVLSFGEGKRTKEEALELGNEALMALELGVDFSQLANRLSDDPANFPVENPFGRGGKLDYSIAAARPGTLGQEYRQSVVALEAAGAVTQPVVSQIRNGSELVDAVFLFRADEIIPESYRALSQVESNIRRMIANERATEEARQMADDWEVEIDEVGSIAEFAESVGAPLKRTDWVELDRPIGYLPGVGNLSKHNEVIRLVYEEGDISPVLDLGGNGYVVLEVAEESPAHVPTTIDDLPTSRVVYNKLTSELAMTKALDDAQAFVRELEASDAPSSFSVVAKAHGWSPGSQSFVRSATPPALSRIPDFSQKTLGAAEGELRIEEIRNAGGGASAVIVWQVADRAEPTLKEFADELPSLQLDYLSNKAQALTEEYLADLRAEGKLKVEINESLR